MVEFTVRVRGEGGNGGRWLEVFPEEPAVGYGSMEDMNAEAHALKTLLEAAPDLLAACEALVAVSWDIGMHDSGDGVTHRFAGDGVKTGCKWCIAKANACAAIAKARGGAR